MPAEGMAGSDDREGPRRGGERSAFGYQRSAFSKWRPPRPMRRALNRPLPALPILIHSCPQVQRGEMPTALDLTREEWESYLEVACRRAGDARVGRILATG